MSCGLMSSSTGKPGVTSILSGQQPFLLIVTTAALVIAMIALIKYYKTSGLLRCAIVFIIGGAIGNMIDRLRLGYVVDMFDVHAIQFAIFNIADCFITVGAILAAIYVLKSMIIEIRGAKKHAKN